MEEPPAEGPAVPRTELQELQLKATEKTDEVREVHSIENTTQIAKLFYLCISRLIQSLESTRRMLALCEEVSKYVSSFYHPV